MTTIDAAATAPYPAPAQPAWALRATGAARLMLVIGQSLGAGRAAYALRLGEMIEPASTHVERLNSFLPYDNDMPTQWQGRRPTRSGLRWARSCCL